MFMTFKIQIRQLLIFIIFLILICLQNVASNQVIYNPLPIIDFNTQSIGRYLSSTIIIEDQPQILVSVFLQECLALFDVSNFYFLAQYTHIVQEAISRGKFLYFITQDHKMIIQQFVPNQNIEDNQHQYLINVNVYENDSYSFNSIYVDPNQKYLYIGCFGQLIILDVSNKLNIQQVALLNFASDFTYWITIIDNEFVFLSNYYSSLIILDISDIHNPQYYRNLTMVGKESIQTYYFKELQIIYSISYYYSLSIFDVGLLFQDKTQFQTMDESEIVKGNFNIHTTYFVNSMYVSSDENYLYITIRSNGFLIYDISTPEFKMNPQFIMNVSSFGFSTFIQTFGMNDRYIVFSEGISLKVFQKTIPNTSQTILNTFNKDQCIFVNCFQELWPWGILFFENKYLVVNGGLQGFQIYDMSIPLVPIMTFQDKRANSSHDTSYYLSERKILLIGLSEHGIAFYNTSLSNSEPTFLFTKIFSDNPDTDDFVSNKEQNILAFVDEKSFGFIDITDIYNTFVIDSFQVPPTESRSFEGISMDENFLYGCCAMRNRGVYYFKFDYPKGEEKSGKKKIQIINFVELYGAESVRYDKRKNGVFYVADGVSGVSVLYNADKSQNIDLINQQSVLGWVGRVYQPDGNLNILIVNHHDRGSLSVMDITDWLNVQKIQEMQFIPYGSYASVTDLKNTFLAITVTNGFRVCLTNSPINLHAQMVRSAELVNQNLVDVFTPFDANKKTDNQIAAKIGESVSFTVVPIYYTKGIQFQSLYLYDQYQTKQIPSWITFQPFSQNIQIVPQNIQNSSSQGSMSLLLGIYLQIYSTDFISQQFNIGEQQSKNLYNYIMDNGILSQDGYIRNTYDSSVRYKVDWRKIYGKDNVPSEASLSKVYDFVKSILDRSIFFYPIFIRILPSLTLDLTNTTGVIQTYSNQVILVLTLVIQNQHFSNFSKQPQFIPQTFNGVLSDMKRENQILELRGLATSINKILNEQIFIFSPDQSTQFILVEFQVDDYINISIYQTFYMNEIIQFKLKTPLTIQSKLQDQYDQQYPGGLYVEQTFQININKSSFQSEKFIEIKYQVQLQEGIWRDLVSSDWIHFDNLEQSLQISGKGSLLDLQKSFVLKVIASDGYEEISDTFVIQFSKIPLTIILSYVGYLLIAVFVGLFLYCIRQKIHHKFFPQQYRRQIEKIQYKNVYFKKIYLMKDFHSISTKLIDLLKQEYEKNHSKDLSYFQKKKFQAQKSLDGIKSNIFNNVQYNEMMFLKQYIDDQGLPNMDKITSDIKNLYKSHTSKFKQLNISKFNSINSRLQVSMKSIFTLRILQTDRQTLDLFNILKKTLKKKNCNSLNWYQHLLEQQPEIVQSKKTLTKNQEIKLGPEEIPQSKLNKQQTDEIKVNNGLLNNETNFTLSQPSQQFMQNKTQNSMNYQQSDVFNIPEIKINEDALLAQINQIQKSYQEQGLKLLIQNQSGSFYNIQLLQSAILAEYYGFGQKYKPKSYRSSYGSVIHLSQDQIKEVNIFFKESDQDQQKKGFLKSICNKIKAFLFINYKKIGQSIHSAQNIRNWLRYQINENYIVFQGSPEKLNLGEYLVQILNSDKYIVYEYPLQVVLNKQDTLSWQHLKSKPKKPKDLSQSKNLQKSKFNNDQSIFLLGQQKQQRSSHEFQALELQQPDNSLKVIQLKIPETNCFQEYKLQRSDDNNNSSITSYNLNKVNKKIDELESSNSTFDQQKRFSFDKSYAQMIPQFCENSRKQEKEEQSIYL